MPDCGKPKIKEGDATEGSIFGRQTAGADEGGQSLTSWVTFVWSETNTVGRRLKNIMRVTDISLFTLSVVTDRSSTSAQAAAHDKINEANSGQLKNSVLVK